jgi:hypothetical protein
MNVLMITHLLVDVQLSENLGGIQKMLVVEDPKWQQVSNTRLDHRPEVEYNSLLSVEGKERQVQNDSQPIPVNHEEESQESVNSGFRDDVGIQAVTEINRVDVITVQPDKSVSTVTVSVFALCHQKVLLTILNRCT